MRAHIDRPGIDIGDSTLTLAARHPGDGPAATDAMAAVGAVEGTA